MPLTAYESGTIQKRDLPRNVLDNLLEGCQVIDDEYRYVYVNDAVVAQAKIPREDLLGRTMMECYPGIENTELFAALTESLASSTTAMIENRFAFPDGSHGWFELRLEPVPGGVAILSIDITERRSTQESLQKAVSALATLTECNRHLVRAESVQSFLQGIAATIVENGNYEGVAIDERLERDGEDHFQRAITVGTVGHSPAERRRQIVLDVKARDVLGTLTIQSQLDGLPGEEERKLLEEISADLGYGIQTIRARELHKTTEEQLAVSRRLEAMGRLAGGVAHDFNNLLTVILAYARLSSDSLREDDPIRQDIEQIHNAGEQAAALTRQLLAFSRKQTLEPKPAILNQIIAHLDPMLRSVVGHDIKVCLRLDPEVGTVLVDQSHIEQVVMNLTVNARDAMARRGGTLTIATCNIEVDAASTMPGRLPPGRFVKLTVSDSGIGMSKEVQQRIFEPFFTTKGADQGTGLGLSTVYGIVKQSGGSIWVESEEGTGTTLTLCLPRVDVPLINGSRETRESSRSQGNETILLVEEDAAMRIAARRILEGAGYRVLAAATGETAVALFHQCGGKVDLVLTDAEPPYQSGAGVASQLKELSPGMKVLFMVDDDRGAPGLEGGPPSRVNSVNKPFSGEDLTVRVRQILDFEKAL